jgi:hypothetical protein
MKTNILAAFLATSALVSLTSGGINLFGRFFYGLMFFLSLAWGFHQSKKS